MGIKHGMYKDVTLIFTYACAHNFLYPLHTVSPAFTGPEEAVQLFKF